MKPMQYNLIALIQKIIFPQVAFEKLNEKHDALIATNQALVDVLTKKRQANEIKRKLTS